MTRFGQEHFDKGVEVGRAEGQASVLARLLEKRFGAVPNRVRERIFSTDLPSLDAWLERVLEAPDLQSVFGPN